MIAVKDRYSTLAIQSLDSVSRPFNQIMLSFFVSWFHPAYWNATRAFMILSAMSCFAGIITGIMSFAHFSSFERFNRSYAAGIMFFISSESGHLWKICETFILGWIMTDTRLLPSQPSLFCWAWPFTRGWQSTSWGDALGTGASPGPTSWAGSPCLWHFLQVKREKKYR